ncbi:uncharacterized protein LOC135939770 [Cloeon dipterum]|uniref:uncharacterized protein LOC135939770 n=1 Tax=Cloeon dipterum TaxID=197152 RepID=UPI0032205626
MVPPKRGSDGSYSSFSSSSGESSSGSRGTAGSSRQYVDPWDVENALYVRGKRISFATDPNTFSAATAAVEPQQQPPQQACGCESLYDGSSVLIPEPLPSVRYITFCPLCDVEEHLPTHNLHNHNNVHNAAAQGKKLRKTSSILSKHSPPASVTYKVPMAIDMDSCEECSAASCSPVAPPPPLMLFSNGRKLSAAGLQLAAGAECVDCEDNHLASFMPTPRRFSVPTQPKLAYVYDAPRAKAKISLPSWSSARDRSNDAPLYRHHDTRYSDSNIGNRWERMRRPSLALPPVGLTPTPIEECGCGNHAGPHAELLAPPRHPCEWGMARSGHVAIDYTNAWMSLARRIKPSRT